MTGRRVAAVIGSPIGHSLSPTIHRAAFAAAGLDWDYVAFDVPAGHGAAAVEAMRTLGLVGLSVTMPHKDDVFAAVDRREPAAEAMRSVNTVSWDGDELVGASTDGDGFVASLAEHGIDPGGCSIAVLGAGGAARSVVDALGRAGAGEIVVVNRTAERAAQAAALATVARAGAPADIAAADIVVNATNVGMGVDPASGGPADVPCDPDLLHPEQVAVDLVYHPLLTPWLAAASARGVRTLDGLGMLVHQAALQQLRWTGRMPDVAVMRAAAEQELRRRR